VDGTVTDTDFDCGSSCNDTGLWEIGGTTGVVVYDRMYMGSDWAAQNSVTPVTGIMGYRFNRARIMPREDADFGAP